VTLHLALYSPKMSSMQYTEHKGFAEDLTEGKFSFPIIHGIREKPDSKYIISTIAICLLSGQNT
jgi:hypothetical protein